LDDTKKIKDDTTKKNKKFFIATLAEEKEI
jgi:hypothetical protein